MQAPMSLLRFMTCGSVDDGKSTLIGRLLYDTRQIFTDQLSSLQKDSVAASTSGEPLDLALLLDGLEAEREQGITIDVAYRFFSTPQRRFIVADTPGHIQYTRNMVTGASVSDLAIILVDARSGLIEQTRRHTFLINLLGIRHVVLAVNKMDLVGFSQAHFTKIRDRFQTMATSMCFSSVVAIPLCARSGETITWRSEQMSWYHGPTLLEHLETIEVEEAALRKPFRLPVQWVNRPDADFRGYSGTIASGSLKCGDSVVVARSDKVGTIARILSQHGETPEAHAGEAVTVTLAENIDVSRGNILSSANALPQVADRIAADLVWMSETPLLLGRSYILKCGYQSVGASISSLKYEVDINTGEKLSSETLWLNGIARAHLSLAESIAFDPYAENRETGAFILIDRLTNETIGAGMILAGLRRQGNLRWQAIDISREAHALQKNQKPRVLWFTGLSGTGKSTIANIVERKLHALGRHTFLLDGDNIRQGLNRDLGFSDGDRIENIRRVAEVAKLMADAGLIVLVAFISPFREEREMARQLIGRDEFVEIFVDTPLSACEARDVKGLYARARAGEIPSFTGIDSPYEPPLEPDLRILTLVQTAESAADTIVAMVQAEPGPA